MIEEPYLVVLRPVTEIGRDQNRKRLVNKMNDSELLFWLMHWNKNGWVHVWYGDKKLLNFRNYLEGQMPEFFNRYAALL